MMLTEKLFDERYPDVDMRIGFTDSKFYPPKRVGDFTTDDKVDYMMIYFEQVEKALQNRIKAFNA